MAPGNADAYNGQQGDIWDAQKDMALAFVGTLIAAVVSSIRKKRS
jgi:putative membrane protein